MVVVGFFGNIGSVFFFIHMLLYFDLDHRAVVMLMNFR